MSRSLSFETPFVVAPVVLRAAALVARFEAIDEGERDPIP